MEIWSNSLHQNQYKKILENQRSSGELCDTIIIPDLKVCSNQNEGDTLFAHACILSATSPILYTEILKARSTVNNQSIIISLNGVGGKVWLWVLNYIYQGRVRLEKEESQDTVNLFVSVLHYLKIITDDDLEVINTYWKQISETGQVSLVNVEAVCVMMDENIKLPVKINKNNIEYPEYECGAKLCNVQNTLLDLQRNKCCQANLFDFTSAQLASDSIIDSNQDAVSDIMQKNRRNDLKEESSLKRNRNRRSKSKHKSLTCMYCSKAMQFSKYSGGRGVKRVKNPTCDSCKVMKQRKTKLVSKRNQSKMKNRAKSVSVDNKPLVVGSNNKHDVIEHVLEEHEDLAENDEDSKFTDGISPMYTCNGCGRKLKRHKTFLRHQSSCMLNPRDVMLQLKDQNNLEEHATYSEGSQDACNVLRSECDTHEGHEMCDKDVLEILPEKIENIKQESQSQPENFESLDMFETSSQDAVTGTGQKESLSKFNTEPKSSLKKEVEEDNSIKEDGTCNLDDKDSDDSINEIGNRSPMSEHNADQNETNDEDENDAILNDFQNEEHGRGKQQSKTSKPTKQKPKLNVKIKPGGLKKRRRKFGKRKKVLLRDIKRKTESGSELGNESNGQSSSKKRRSYKKLDSFNVCNLCGEIFKDGTKEKLLKHKRFDCKIGSKKGFVNGPRRVCPICFKQLSSTYKLNFHLKVVHLGEYPYECRLCQKNFKYRNAHRDHMMSVHGEDLITCNCCNLTFDSVEKYHRHKTLGLVSTGDKVQAVFMCEICGETFYDRSNYRTHRLFHMSSEQWKHKCELCNKNFPQKVDKDRHMMIHTGEKPFLCDICSYSTNRKYNLKLHQRKHEAESSESLGLDSKSKLVYSCKTCDTQFKLKTELKAHLKIHDSRVLTSSLRIKKDKAPKENKKPLQVEKKAGTSEDENESVEKDKNVPKADMLKFTPLNQVEIQDQVNEPQTSRSDQVHASYHNPPPVPTEIKSYSQFQVPSSEQSSESKTVIQDRLNVPSLPNQEQIISANNAVMYHERYNPTERVASGSHVMNPGDSGYAEGEVPQAPLPYAYRGSTFMPYSTRGMDGWNLMSKDTVSSIEEAFRIIGMPPVVPVSAVDLSATTSNTFNSTPQPSLTQEAQFSMMTNVYNPTQNYPHN